jgi:hypothetical protein
MAKWSCPQHTTYNVYIFTSRTQHVCSIFIKFGFFLHTFLYKVPNIKIHRNPSRGSPADTCSRAYMTKLLGAFNDYAKAPNKEVKWTHRSSSEYNCTSDWWQLAITETYHSWRSACAGHTQGEILRHPSLYPNYDTVCTGDQTTRVRVQPEQTNITSCA